MSFLRGLIKKDNASKEELEKEAAARPASQKPPKKRENPIAGKEAGAPVQKRAPKGAGQKTVVRALKRKGLVDDEQLDKAMAGIKDEEGTTLQKSLVKHDYVREENILDALASELGMEKADLRGLQPSEELLALIPKKVARNYRVFPVEMDDYEVSVAIADPTNIEVLDDLARIVGKPIRPLIASESDIDRLYKRFYEGDEIRNVYEGITEGMHQDEVDAQAAEAEQELQLEEDESAPPVVRFVDLLFKQAVHERASDIHIEPIRQGITIRFRVDGVLHEVPAPPKKWQNAILSRLKVLSGMDLAEKRVPQDGRIKLSLPDRKLDLRVSALPGIHGESIVMRILDQSTVLLGLEDVGFLPDNISTFNSLIRRPTGVILMTGPTGSGKTTTLYAALSTLNNSEVKIVTIENPVEYMIDGINQVQVNDEIGLDFSMGLRSLLRQSPDVLLVGEMRDSETAEIGIRAALTGHLVFSTLHTNDAPSAPGRLVDMGVKPFLVASSLQAVIAQRLVRRLCGVCKTPHVHNEAELQEVGATDEEIAARNELDTHVSAGCDRCNNTGYRGRTAIHEIMTLDSRIRRMIIRGESAFRIKKAAVRAGMRSLRMDGWEKVKLGQTSLGEIMRITQND